ncbi:MAG: hypothetical protein HQ506_04265 [Candidatus Marinimicrobia bacterium]|nr:hypothetical protein [Candidatus Neomarinimicrobiota bacterium]
MHVFTITLKTSPFGLHADELTHEEVAKKIHYKFLVLLKKHKLDKILQADVYWSKGCLTMDFVMISTTGLALHTLKNYKDYREGIVLLINDLKFVTVRVKNRVVRINSVVRTTKKPQNKSHRLKVTPSISQKAIDEFEAKEDKRQGKDLGGSENE